MVYDADTTARNAENDATNDPGYCLQWCRQKAGIPALYPDASTAWKHATTKHPGNYAPPRGGMVYWTGGSHGYGHIAVALGDGVVRSTDAGGPGRVATVPISWVATHWGLPFAGWAWDVNGVMIPHDEEEDEDMPSPKDWTDADWNVFNSHVENAVWLYEQKVTKPDDDTEKKSMKQLVRETWQRVAKL